MKMTKKTIEPDVDYIGGLGALTDDEEKALSEFFLKQKLHKRKPAEKKTSKISKKQKSKV
jgi:hypothetical protein